MAGLREDCMHLVGVRRINGLDPLLRTHTSPVKFQPGHIPRAIHLLISKALSPSIFSCVC
jgi:hypothetical protein